MIRCTYIQSGELVTILEVKKRLKIKFMKSLRARILLLLVVVGIVPCIVLGSTILHSHQEKSIERYISQIQNQCTILSNQLESYSYLSSNDSKVVDAELTQLSNVYNGRILVINDEFRIVKDTYELDEGKTVVSEDVIRCYRGKGTVIYDEKNRFFEVTTPVKSNKQVIGVVLMSVSTDNIMESGEDLKNICDLIIGTMAIIILIIAVLLSTLMVRPFGRITKAIEAVNEGYESEDLCENTYTETALISDAFNKMLGRMRVVDKSREEFVSNVSHELKTPLTSMKVLADSLLAQEDVPVELYKEFMGDITEEIERENKIINDLLSLVKMDKTSANINIQSENINELLERILKRLRPIAKQHNIEVVFESFRPVMAEGDEVKMSLALSNLVENAIKYNNPGGKVQVTVCSDKEQICIQVMDNGSGIPADMKERVFEPFFRVDKSRSRALGGVGLGLALVREIVRVHDGAIRVLDNSNGGTTFEILFPETV